MKNFFKPSFLTLLAFLPFLSQAQDSESQPPYRPTPAHMWEIGLHGGTAMSFGDVDFTPNWGAGFHVRKAIDYVFSVRGEGFYGKLQQDDQVNGSSESTVQSGSLQLIATLNNLVWNNVPRRKTNLYIFLGGGLTNFKVDANNIINADLRSVDPTLQTHLDFGVGVALRISKSFNLGFETKGLVLFGRESDLLDGVDRRNDDVMAYGSVRLNFNLGNHNKKAEPLYWVNPMDLIMQDITELKNRPKFDMTDSDADGVIDLLDQDNTTPPGVVVDTRGLPLDSDGDGVPNYQDDEPYLTKDSKIVTRKDGQAPITTEDDVRRVLGEEMNKMSNDGRAGTFGGGITDWFLPIIHFNIDSYKIRYAEYGSLSGISHVMKTNPSLQVVVTGFTDKTASEEYNLGLSYQRAKAAIEHLVNTHGIARSRFLLNYNGEDYPLVPYAGSTLMNRRVEFRVANSEDVEMDNPSPVTKKGKKDGF